MPRRANHHIPAPVRSARAPGASYCGLREPFLIPDPIQMRRHVVALAREGKARHFCPICLSEMLKDAAAAAERGKRASLRRMETLSPERRAEIAHGAVSARWKGYRERKAEEARAHLAVVPTTSST